MMCHSCQRAQEVQTSKMDCFPHSPGSSALCEIAHVRYLEVYTLGSGPAGLFCVRPDYLILERRGLGNEVKLDHCQFINRVLLEHSLINFFLLSVVGSCTTLSIINTDYGWQNSNMDFLGLYNQSLTIITHPKLWQIQSLKIPACPKDLSNVYQLLRGIGGCSMERVRQMRNQRLIFFRVFFPPYCERFCSCQKFLQECVWASSYST